MSEGFYSRKTGQWWDQVIERREAGDDDTAFDIAQSLIIELDEKAAGADRWRGEYERLRRQVIEHLCPDEDVLTIDTLEAAGEALAVEAERSRWAGVVEKVRALQEAVKAEFPAAVDYRAEPNPAGTGRFWEVTVGDGEERFSIVDTENGTKRAAEALADLLNLPLDGGGSDV